MGILAIDESEDSRFYSLEVFIDQFELERTIRFFELGKPISLLTIETAMSETRILDFGSDSALKSWNLKENTVVSIQQCQINYY